MKCPKCGSINVGIEGQGTWENGSFRNEHATNIHCFDCRKDTVLPSKPFWETVFEMEDKKLREGLG